MDITSETLAELTQLMGKLPPELLSKAYALTAEAGGTFPTPGSPISGLIAYDLEPSAKNLYPVLTPLRNRIPRIGGGFGTATNWRAILGIDTTNVPFGVPEGVRGGTVSTEFDDRTAPYCTVGLEDYVTFESDSAGRTFVDQRALASMNLLKAAMISEEKTILGGNRGLALGTTPTPTVANILQANAPGAAASSLLAATTYAVRCVALTFEGYTRTKVSNLGGVPIVLTITPAGGGATFNVNGGSAVISDKVADGAVPANNGDWIKASVAAVKGAVAYAWFVGDDAGGDAGCKLFSVTTTPYVLINAVGGTYTKNTTFGATSYGVTANDLVGQADHSKNSYVFDGILSTVAQLGYWTSLGAKLTKSGHSTIKEIDDVLEYLWETKRVSPTEMLMSAQELKDIGALTLADTNANPLIRFNIDGKNTVADLTRAVGTVVGFYLNQFSMDGGQLIPIRLHPNLPPGCILFQTYDLPYPASNVANVMEVKTRREYYQIEWPLVTRRYQYGVYAEECLRVFAPFTLAVLAGIEKQ